MNARISRSARAGRGSSSDHDERTGDGPDLVFDDLVDARFDDQGRLSQVGRGSHQRIAERLEPRPPATSAEDLEQAVQKLAAGLEAIERQSRTTRRPEATVSAPASGERDFVTYSLDRLEARLEALSERLQSRSGGRDAAAATPSADDPSLAVASHEAEQDYASEGAELRRLAEAEAERVQRETEAEVERSRLEAETRRRAEDEAAEAARLLEEEAAEAARRAEEKAAEIRRQAEEARLQAEEDAAEAARIAEEEAAEARRQTEEAMRRAEAEAAEARRKAEEEAAEAKRQAEAEAAEARRRAEEAEAEARRQAEAAEAERAARAADARREAEAAAETRRQFAEVEARIDALQQSCDENQIAPVREELVELLHEIEELGRDRGDIAGALKEIGARLGDMEVKVNSARNMAGNRLGDIQDRLSGLTDRLDGIEVEIPGFDAVRENQAAILERFDRMEGLVQRLASAEDLMARVDSLRRQLGTVATRQEATQLEEKILGLAERLDALPEELNDADALREIEDRLGALATELVDARRERTSTSEDIDRRLSELSVLLREVGESGLNPDLTSVEDRLDEFSARLDRDRELSGDTLSRLERQVAELTAAIEEQEGDAEILAALTRKIDALAEAVDAQDIRGARSDIEGLNEKLDQVAQHLAEQAEHMPHAQVAPLEERFEQTQQQLEELAHYAQESSEQLRPFAQKLQEIADRVSALGDADERSPLASRLEAIEERIAGLGHARGPDPRALQTQMDGIVSRLELLKGRSIDPAHLTELFDRVDAAIRAMPEESRFDRLEQQLAAAIKTSDLAAHADAAEEQMARLERLEELIIQGQSGGFSEDHFARLEQRIAESASAALAARGAPVDLTEERFARLEGMLEQIAVAYSPDGELLSPADLAELREDVLSLRHELHALAGDGEGSLGDVLQGVTRRMDRPDDSATTVAELEAKMDRLAELLDDPTHSSQALAQIELSLKTIEERLEDTRRALAYRPAEDGEIAHPDVEAVAGLARALSDDVNVLKGSTEASEKKTQYALDAVQDTLEAVVKRMAFLEHDSEAAAARPPADLHSARTEDGRTSDPDDDAAEEDTARLAVRLAPVRPAAEAPEPSIGDPAAGQAETGAKPDASEPSRSGGLLSRFTSRQLLKRATGGRAESFTPGPEESEEGSDLPLEPGTDAPLSSSLTDAPSSDTAFMSGARNRARMAVLIDAGDDDAAQPTVGEAAPVDEDFLTAARRAARAAAEADGEGAAHQSGLARIGSIVKARRRSLMAAALAVAVAVAALQIIRTQMNTGESEIAVAPSASEPAAPVAATPPPVVAAPDATQTAMTPPADALPSGAGTETTENMESAGAEAPATAATATSDETPPPTAGAASDQRAEDDVAALSPAEEPAATAVEPDAAELEELPIEIGSQRLRDAAAAGDPAAAFEVAARYAEGLNGLQDMRTAVEWYERAANAGLAPAQYRLGSIYEKGLGVPRDIDKAQIWYTRAVDVGNVKAMHNLAVLFAEGANGDPDLERAAALFRRAADYGVRDSQFNLAILHARGLGVPQDLIEAYKWFSVASTSGDEESAKRRDIIAAALSEQDLAKAQVAAASFEPVPLVSEANEVKMPPEGWNDPQDSTSVEAQPTGDEMQISSAMSENDLVALVQKLLADQGFDPGPADGLFGEQTMQAIWKFQDKAGLPRTGQIDPHLLEALEGASGSDAAAGA